MDMQIFHYFNDRNEYTYSLENPNEGALCPDNAAEIEPEFKAGFWPVWDGVKWAQVEDHRKHFDDRGREVEGTGTPYWLPDADHASPAQYMIPLGPLPEGACTTAPPITLDEVKTLKRQAFATTFATIEQRAQRPQSAVLTALIDAAPVPEPDADYIWQLEDIKATNRELLHQLEACTNVASAQQIEPWLPPVQSKGQGVG